MSRLEQQIQKNNKQLSVYFPLTQTNDFTFKAFCKLDDLINDVVDGKSTKQDLVNFQQKLLVGFRWRYQNNK